MHTLDGKKVLVIGGAGFIGSHVVKELLKEPVKEVIVYDNFCRSSLTNIAESLKDERCSVFEDGADVNHLDTLNAAMKGCDYVFHLAALWLLHCRDYPRSAFTVNIEGTYNVLEACVNNKVKKLIYSSSASVYGTAVQIPMTEEHPFMNRNFYGATKIAGEAMCRAFNDRFGLDYVGLRYMNVYGPLQDQKAVYSGVIPIVLNKIDTGVAPVVNGDGSQAYDFVYVEDVARANICALKSDATDDFYNVGTGVRTSVKELCETMLELKESSLKVDYRPYSKEDSRALVQDRVGSIEKAEAEAGYRFKYSLKDGLQRLIKWRHDNPEG